jgi:hypothetical protein
MASERMIEALRIRKRWNELGRQMVEDFPHVRRMTQEEIERFLAINREQQELLPQLPGWCT